MNRISRGRLLALLAVIVVLIAAVPAFRYYRYLKTHVSTDDAYVDGNIVLIAPKVAGTVNRVYVSENFIVNAGDLLVSLDPQDFEVRVDQAKAQLSNARNSVDQMFSQLAAAEAGDRLAEAQLRQAEVDFKRAK